MSGHTLDDIRNVALVGHGGIRQGRLRRNHHNSRRAACRDQDWRPSGDPRICFRGWVDVVAADGYPRTFGALAYDRGSTFCRLARSTDNRSSPCDGK